MQFSALVFLGRDGFMVPRRSDTGLTVTGNPPEQELYQTFIAGTFGPAIRLEQEHVSFAGLERAV
jgi:hypothetical protein